VFVFPPQAVISRMTRIESANSFFMFSSKKWK